MGTDGANGSQTARRQGKVARLIDDYGLDGLGDELEEFWTAEGDERKSLRDLADYVNLRLLEASMSTAGMQPVQGEAENIYEILAGEEASDADRIRVRRRLEREGIDVDSLTQDFLTYQAVRTYLTQDRNVEYDETTDSQKENGKSTVQRLRGRTSTVTASRIEHLRNTDELELGEFQVMVDVQVLCEDCGKRYEFGELLENGGCDCQTDTES